MLAKFEYCHSRKGNLQQEKWSRHICQKIETCFDGFGKMLQELKTDNTPKVMANANEHPCFFFISYKHHLCFLDGLSNYECP